jgi:hypothetical protein
LGTLKEALGLTRQKPLHAKTFSRAMARFSLGQFRIAFAHWLATQPDAAAAEAEVAATNGKTSKQGHGAHGDLSTCSTSSGMRSARAWLSSP